MTSRPPLSVVMPAYNEEGAIEAATAEVREFVLDRIAGSELVVVNDGSRDNTGPILDRICANDPRIRVVHQANGGHGPALRAAIEAANGELLLFLDSDRQIPLTEVEPLPYIDLFVNRARALSALKHNPDNKQAVEALKRIREIAKTVDLRL